MANLIKYSRTFHLPWSLGVTDDDKVIPSVKIFEGRQVVVTEKMDGENTSMYSHAFHARSLDSKHHYTRDWVKQFWASIARDIPENWRVCGENMYAKHSIEYTNLESYFYGFSVWNEKNEALSWDDTLDWFKLLGITPVPVLYRGIWNEKVIKSLWNKGDTFEGYVVRSEDSFAYDDFKSNVAKFVRPNHVTTDTHWKFGVITPNKLKA